MIRDSSRREFLRTAFAASAIAAVRPRFSAARSRDARDDDVLRARLAADPLRPQFHLLPARNWMNDPNGPIYWKGHYHMFFQYNPNAAVWGDMHWAHAVSDDMMHWRHRPTALAPTPGWDDADGCFTGSAVDDRGTATFLYTGVKTVTPERATLRDGVHNFREVVCLATSGDPQLLSWTKGKTPVIEPPHDARLTGFRDPFLWRDLGTWYLGVASGIRKEGGNVLLYRSKDLRQWEYLHPLASGKWNERDLANPVDSGEMWECPDFFELGGKQVLLYSTAGEVYWETGELDPKQLVFHSQKHGILDHGAYYAQKTQLDANGSRILWGWIPETRPEAEFSAAGWAGCMALPRALSISADGQLEMRFASESQTLRAKAFLLPKDNAPDTERASAVNTFAIEGLSGEIVWKTRAGSAVFTVADRSGPWLSVLLETPQGSLEKLTVNGKSIGLPGRAKSEREFHLFLDASVVELICDQMHAITTRVYRKPEGPLHLALADSDLRAVSSLGAWTLRPISSDRLTSPA
jgi:beta-fructofuranosidase